MELGFLKNLLVISTDSMGLNIIGIISLNFAKALSGRHLEKEFFINGNYSDNEKSKVFKLWADRIRLCGSTIRFVIV